MSDEGCNLHRIVASRCAESNLRQLPVGIEDQRANNIAVLVFGIGYCLYYAYYASHLSFSRSLPMAAMAAVLVT